MEEATGAGIANVGIAALIAFTILKIVFDYLTTKDKNNKSKNGGSNSNSNGNSFKPAPCLSLEEQRLLKIMSIQMEEVHDTVLVSKVFQIAQNTILEQNIQLTNILKELVTLNKNITDIVSRIAILTESEEIRRQKANQ
jgi:hypothetical protein